MTTNKPAGFLLRLLAALVDGQIFYFPTALLLAYIASSVYLSELGQRLLVLLMYLLLTIVIGLLYNALTTYYFGGNFGKLLAGLRVTGQDGQKMGFKRLFFRYSVGYQFSALLFGLGFWAIIKDKEKLSWHDKAIGSKVVIVQNTWLIALILFVMLLIVNLIISISSVQSFLRSPLYYEQVLPYFQLEEEITPTPTPMPFTIEEETI